MRKTKVAVERRAEQFADKVVTRFWYERPAENNPYITAQALCHGYDLQELMAKCSYWEFIYLLFTGERPKQEQETLLQQLAIALANPGPRHPATRAAMTAAVSRTDPNHILPIGLNVLGGAHQGGAQVSKSMRFLRRHLRRDPVEAAQSCVEALDAGADEGSVAPGFGTCFAGIDMLAQRCAEALAAAPGAGPALAWGKRFAVALNSSRTAGWLMPGVAAATLLDLGFHPKWGAGFYQMLSAPGLLAHGMEMTGKPLTAMPFITDDRYHIDEST